MHSPDDKVSLSKRIPALSGQVTIPYQVVSFDIAFESLSYVAPSKNLYAYKLDGIHKEWIYTDKHNVSFLNLPPGEYTFRVKASTMNIGAMTTVACILKFFLHPGRPFMPRFSIY